MWYEVKEWYDSHQLSLSATYNIPLLIFLSFIEKAFLKQLKAHNFQMFRRINFMVFLIR